MDIQIEGPGGTRMTKQETSAGIIVYQADDIMHQPTYLLLHYISGHWDFAKGKLEPGETKLQAAIRELKEETSLEAQVHDHFEESLSYLFRNRKGEMINKTVTFFVGKETGGDIALSREHIAYIWLPFQEALQKLTYTNARQVLTKAHHFLMNNKDLT